METNVPLLSILMPSFSSDLDELALSNDGLQAVTTTRLANALTNSAAACTMRGKTTEPCAISPRSSSVRWAWSSLAASEQPAPTDWRVNHALTWFEEHMHQAPNCETIASAVGCSAAHLRRLFKDAGVAPIVAQLDERRLRRATAMLREQRWTTAYITAQCDGVHKGH